MIFDDLPIFKRQVLPLLLSLTWCSAVSANDVVVSYSSVPVHGNLDVQSGQLIVDNAFWPSADRLLSSEREGLFLLDRGGQVLSRLQGTFGGVDHRAGPKGLLVAMVDLDRQQAAVVSLSTPDKGWSSVHYLPHSDFKIESVCLYRDDVQNEFVFMVGEEGRGEQWLVAQHEVALAKPLKIRNLSLPPESQFCQVDDQAGLLYVNEENMGWWAYEAHPEAPLVRHPVGLRKPFGNINGAAAGMAVVPGGLVALDAETAALHPYLYDGKSWAPLAPVALADANEPEVISARVRNSELQLLMGDDTGLRAGRLGWVPPAPPVVPSIPVLQARVQTAEVPSLGDAADDPAIWIHPDNPALSLVLGTDKQGGLLVFDLEGKLVQDLAVGRINNVDIRTEFKLGDEVVDLAIATNRDHNSLHVFAIDRSSGELRVVGELPTALNDIYGFCMFKDTEGDIYAIPNDKDGTFLQYRLSAPGGTLKSELLRRFMVGSQPEGCVADDREQRLFIGEETVAVWTLDARHSAPTTLTKVIGIGDVVHADIEGLAIYDGAQGRYLVLSSQGNDSYVILDAAAPYAVRGAFRVGLNAQLGIDGVSETDGLEVTSVNLGGPWTDGMLVVQDGRKRMPEANQNFKYVPWTVIAEALGLD